MIKNERQYRITKAQAEKFADALTATEAWKDGDTLLAELEKSALRSQVEELRQQLSEYEALRSGACGVISVDSFDKLPQALVQARIAMGLSQKELADRLNMKEQQIQRYEATDYRSASLSRLQEVVAALGIDVREDLFLPASRLNVKALFDRLESAGVDRQLVLKRIVPPAIAERLSSTPPTASDADIRSAGTTIGRIFQWTTDELFGVSPLRMNTTAAGLARFKVPSNADERKVSAYTVYAHYIALLVLDATPSIETRTVPTDPEECRDAILSNFGAINFETVLKYAWDLGIPVLPLSDSGAFHGACWRVDWRNVIVLKQRHLALARWTHDCLHEVYHAGQEPGVAVRSVVESSEMSAERRESEEEQEATLFAADVMLDGRAEELAQMCVNAASGDVRRLKTAVTRVADDEDVEVGALANYMAFRLSLQGLDWWGAATNLQRTKLNPWEIARDWLMPRLALDRLGDVDRQILLQALTTTE